MNSATKKLLEDKRRQRETQNFRTGLTSTTTTSTEPETSYTFEQAIGSGLEIKIAGKEYEIRPFPMRRLQAMAEAFNKYPMVWLAQALLTPGDSTDVEKVADKLNVLSGMTGVETYYTPSETHALMLSVQVNMSSEQLETLLETVIKTLKFWYPLEDADATLIKDSIVIDEMIDVARKVFLLNTGLRDRFVEAQP